MKRYLIIITLALLMFGCNPKTDIMPPTIQSEMQDEYYLNNTFMTVIFTAADNMADTIYYDAFLDGVLIHTADMQNGTSTYFSTTVPTNPIVQMLRIELSDPSGNMQPYDITLHIIDTEAPTIKIFTLIVGDVVRDTT